MKRALRIARRATAAALSVAVTALAGGPLPAVLRLEDAERVALENQPAILQARAQTRAAEGRIAEARSPYLPHVTGQGLAELVHGNAVSRPGSNGAPSVGTPTAQIRTFDIFAVGVSATQLIWDFGQTIDRTRSAGASRDAFASTERTAGHQVLLQVRQAFFQAYAQKALAAVAQETVTNQEKHLAQIKGFVEQSIRPAIDLAQAKNDLANARVALIKARAAYAIARAQLNQAMGVLGPTTYEVAEEHVGPVPGEDDSVENLVREALLSRPELAGLEKQRHASELLLSSIHDEYLPSLSAFGGVSEAGASLDTLGLNWNVGATLVWPIYQGGLVQGQAEEARGNLDAASADVKEEELAVRVQVEQASLDVKAAKAGIDAARDSVVNARERLRLAEGRYESGVGSIIELDDAELASANAGAQLVSADYSLSSARADLLSALGK